MILELEPESNDFNGPSLKLIPETNSEIFMLGRISGEMSSKGGINHVYSMKSGSHMFMRIPLSLNEPSK